MLIFLRWIKILKLKGVESRKNLLKKYMPYGIQQQAIMRRLKECVAVVFISRQI